jgi:predicted nucleic acid-binding Zn ribbon protein
VTERVPRYDSRGRVHGGPVPMSEALGAVAGRLGLGRTDLISVVFGRWEELVGSSVAAHVRPVRLVAGTLIVSADHPAWATQIRQLAPEILQRVASEFGGEDTPVRLEIRVRG